MPSVPQKTFYFQAHANSLGGFLEKPHQKVVTSQASVSLPAVGGHAATRTEAFNFDEIVSCQAAYTRVTGGPADDEDAWSTLVTSVVEGLNILDVVKVERVVAQVSVEHPRNGGNPSISLAGCHFDGFRLGGCDVSPTLNPKLLGVSSVARIEWPIFQQTGRQQAAKLVKSAKSSGDAQWVADRFGWMAADRKPEEDACVLCSLVDGIEQAFPGRVFGHALEIPHFGKIFLGELLVCRSSIQLSMIRAELGCANRGNLGASTAAVRGGTIPPS
jgi:hypothetical protein